MSTDRARAAAPRIGALIPIRLASERLPGKALRELGGRPVVHHLLDRLFASRHLSPERVVVCTTEDASDDALVPAVESLGARVFRGSRDDLVDRLWRAIEAEGFDAVIEVDGDDPFVDVTFIDRALDALLADREADVVLTEGLPLGMGSKALRRGAVERIWGLHRSERNDTGFMYYFTRTGLCRVARVEASPAERHETARVTLDYPEDLAFFEAVWRELSPTNPRFGARELSGLLANRPDLLAINGGLSERYWARTKELAKLEYEVDGKRYTVEV